MIFPVVHIGAIAVSFLFVVSNRILTLCWASIYIYFYLYLPRKIIQILFYLFFSLLIIKFFFLICSFTSSFFVAEALVFASSYSDAPATSVLMFLPDSDNDLARAVAPYLPRGGEAPVPVNLPEGRPLTIDENGRLGLILHYQEQIGLLLKSLDATSVWNHHLAEESAEDLAAATLLHKEEDLNDPDKLWIVQEGLLKYQRSSRYYFRVLAWVRTERQVRNGELPITFIIDDDGEG
jgi:hypothetical protein